MKYEEILEHQDEISTKSIKILWKRFQKLNIKIPDARNTQFGVQDVFRMVLEMSEGKKFARSAIKRLKAKEYRNRKMTGTGRRIPSSDWGLGKLVDVDPVLMGQWCDSTIRFMASKALEAHMIKKTTMVGVDLTLNPYYGKKLKDQMLKTLAKNGTSHFDAYMTTHSIGPGYEIPLSNTRMTGDDKTHAILQENIKKVGRCGILPLLYLADRGFFSVACILAFQESGCDYIMPAVRNSRITELIEAYHRGEIPAAVRHTVYSKEFGSASFNLLIVQKDGFCESDPVADQYVAFATSLPCRTKAELVETIPETYRQRWIEETAFRVIKDVKGKTCSNELHVRIFLFCFALLLYCLWKCTKYADMLQGFLAGGADFTMDEFIESLGHLARDILMWEKSHGNFLEF